ncbi:unnamed protein product, partial [Mycena citricolor]
LRYCVVSSLALALFHFLICRRPVLLSFFQLSFFRRFHFQTTSTSFFFRAACTPSRSSFLLCWPLRPFPRLLHPSRLLLPLNWSSAISRRGCRCPLGPCRTFSSRSAKASSAVVPSPVSSAFWRELAAPAPAAALRPLVSWRHGQVWPACSRSCSVPAKRVSRVSSRRLSSAALLAASASRRSTASPAPRGRTPQASAALRRSSVPSRKTRWARSSAPGLLTESGPPSGVLASPRSWLSSSAALPRRHPRPRNGRLLTCPTRKSTPFWNTSTTSTAAGTSPPARSVLDPPSARASRVSSPDWLPPKARRASSPRSRSSSRVRAASTSWTRSWVEEEVTIFMSHCVGCRMRIGSS